MTVAELIAHLQTLPKQAVVVQFDDFGKPHEIDKWAFTAWGGAYDGPWPPPGTKYITVQIGSRVKAHCKSCGAVQKIEW